MSPNIMAKDAEGGTENGVVVFASRSGSTVDEKEVNESKVANDIRNVQRDHQWDPNLPAEKNDALHRAIETHDYELAQEIERKLVDEEPYEEVQAAVKLEDSGGVANTVRAWVLGLVISTIVTALNMFLSMRSPAIQIPIVVPLLLVYPCGVLWAKVMPRKTFHTCGIRWTLNTGPFNVKEHAVITFMANVTNNYAYSTEATWIWAGDFR